MLTGAVSWKGEGKPPVTVKHVTDVAILTGEEIPLTARIIGVQDCGPDDARLIEILLALKEVDPLFDQIMAKLRGVLGKTNAPD